MGPVMEISETNLADIPPEITGSTQVMICPETTRHSWWQRRSRIQRMSMVVLGLGICVIVISCSVAFGLKNETTRPKRVCRTSACKESALRLSLSLNLTVDPCEDFYAFCCDGWLKENPLPDDMSRYGITENMTLTLSNTLRGVIENTPLQSLNSFALRNVAHYYKSCMNTAAIDREDGQTRQSARKFLNKIGGWPLLGTRTKWNEKKYSWSKTISFVISEVGFPVIIGIVIMPDERNTTSNILQIEPSSLGLEKKIYLENNTEIIDNYKKLIFETAKSFESSLLDNQLEEQIDELVELERQLAQFSSQRPKKELMSLEEFSKKFSNFNWLEFLQLSSNSTMNDFGLKPISKSEPVYVTDEQYLIRVVDYLNSAKSSQIANYIGWRVVYPRLIFLPERARNAVHDFGASLSGNPERIDRWKVCLSFVTSGMSFALTHLFVKENFPPKAKGETEFMVKQLWEAFRSLLNDNVWMDEKTKQGALKKLKAMIALIGYPNWLLNKEKLEAFYKDLNMEKENLTQDPFTTEILARRLFGRMAFSSLRQPNIRDEWTSNPLYANAYYSQSSNVIQFPAAILFPPLYQYERPNYLNFGAIGSVIGHEITHGFDDKGRHRDSEGNIKEWWTSSSNQTFVEKTICFVDQYNSYGVNGANTLTENIADCGGLKESFLAYRKWEESRTELEESLPGLENFTPHQMFFISFGSMWCVNQREAHYRRILETSSHSPSKFRAWGAVSNSEEFAKAFNCRKGQKMNPEKKCSIW